MQDKPVKRLSAEQIQAMFDSSPFISGLDLQFQSLNYDAMELTVLMPLNSSMERRAGTKQFHGGPIASFIDTVGDYAVGMMVGGGVPTINIRIDYLKPAMGDALTATARVRRMGRSVAITDIDVFDENNALVAIGRGTYFPKAG